MEQRVRGEEEREDEAVDGTPEVGGVADVVGAAAGHVPAVEQVERSEDVSRHGDGNQVDIDSHGRLEEDAGEEDGRHGAGCAHGVVAGVVAELDEVADARNGQRADIEDNIQDIPFRRAEDLPEIRFDHPAEEVQGEHVEEQVSPSGMDQAVRQHTVPLMAVPDGPGVELQRLKHPAV